MRLKKTALEKAPSPTIEEGSTQGQQPPGKPVNNLHNESPELSSDAEGEAQLENRLKAFYYNPVRLMLW